jgi:hypothetical protein
MKKLAFHKSILFITTLNLLSCQGTDTNPLKDYPGLKVSEKSNAPSEKQLVCPQSFAISHEDENSPNNGVFLLDQVGRMRISIKPLSGKILSYKTDITHFQHNGSMPTLERAEGSEAWVLSWQPPTNVLSSGQKSKSFAARVEAVVNDGGPLSGCSSAQLFYLNVSQNGEQPKFLKSPSFSSSIQEGSAPISFTIDVEDPASMNNLQSPQLALTDYISNNTEAFIANLNKFVSPDADVKNNPEMLGKGKWRFHYKVEIDNMPFNRDRRGKEDDKIPNVTLCLKMAVLGLSGARSAEQMVCAQGAYALRTPTIEMLEGKTSIVAKEQNIYSISMTKSGGLGQLTLEKVTVSTALKTSREFSCQTKEENQVCEIRWSTDCVTKDTPVVMTITAANSLNGKKKLTEIQHNVLVLPNPEVCVAKKLSPKQGSKK